MTEAPQCEKRCQYAQDVGMPEHSCANKCMYLNHPDNQPEKAMGPKFEFKIGDRVRFTNNHFHRLVGIEGNVLSVTATGLSVMDDRGRTRWFKQANCMLIPTVGKAASSEPASEFDVVAKPKHYQFFPDMEAIDVIARSMTVSEFRGYCLGNRLKYRLRAGAKDDPKQELDKSDAYLKLFERCKGLCYAE